MRLRDEQRGLGGGGACEAGTGWCTGLRWPTAGLRIASSLCCAARTYAEMPLKSRPRLCVEKHVITNGEIIYVDDHTQLYADFFPDNPARVTRVLWCASTSREREKREASRERETREEADTGQQAPGALVPQGRTFLLRPYVVHTSPRPS